MGRMFRGKAVYRRVDFEFSVEDSSYKAVAIVSLVSFMVGLILAFVGAIQLKNFGAQIYVASLVAIGMTRIMGLSWSALSWRAEPVRLMPRQ